MCETWWHSSLCDADFGLIKEGVVEVHMVNSWDNWGIERPSPSAPKSEKDSQEELLPDTPVVIQVPNDSAV